MVDEVRTLPFNLINHLGFFLNARGFLSSHKVVECSFDFYQGFGRPVTI